MGKSKKRDHKKRKSHQSSEKVDKSKTNLYILGAIVFIGAVVVIYITT